MLDQRRVEMRLRPVEIDAGDFDVERLSRSGSAANSCSSALRRARLLSFAIAADIVADGPQMPARLDLGARPRTSEPMCRSAPRRSRQPKPTEKQESARSLLRFSCCCSSLAWALRSFIVAPFNIPSGSMLPTLFIGDYLFVAKWPYGYSRYCFPFGFPSFSGRLFGRLPERGDVVVFRHPARECRPDQARDRPARRHGRSRATASDPQRPAAAARSRLPPYALPISPNSPCRVVPPRGPDRRSRATASSCLRLSRLSARPCRAGRATTCSTRSSDGPADNFGRDHACPRAMSS